MDVHLMSFASEMLKCAEAKDKRQGYFGQMAAAAPFAAASAAAEVPEGAVDRYVERSISGVKGSSGSWKRGISRGGGRLGAGLVTSPVFLSGIRDIQSKDPTERRRGYAKVVGAGAAFGTGKGVLETALEQGLSSGKVQLPSLARKLRAVATSRGLVGTGAAALTAASVAKASKKGPQETKREGVFKKYVAPAATGAALGAGKGAFDVLVEHGTRVPSRQLAGAAGGRAAAGAFGALALTELFKRLAPKEKTAEAPLPATDVYADVSHWAEGQNAMDVYRFAQELNAGGIGERSQPRRAALYALNDNLRDRGHEVPRETGRPDTSDLVPVPGTGSLATVMAVSAGPGLIARALTMLKPSDADRVLEEALDAHFVRGKISRGLGPYLAFPEGGGEEARKAMKMAPGPAIAIPRKGSVQAGLMAHELGHLNPGDLRKATIAHPTTEAALRAGSLMSTVLPIMALVSSGDGRFATKEELERKARFADTVGVLSGMLQLPGIAEEAAASAKAVRLLREVGDSKALQRVVMQAGPGFLSYLAPAAVPFVVAQRMRKAIRDQERDAKSP